MMQLVEPRVRGLVAEHLGVDGDALTADVSLIDDLAADSLDLVELSLVIENDFGIVVPEAALEGVRTFGELVEVVRGRLHDRQAAEQHAAATTPVVVWAHVVQAPGSVRGDLQRTGWLTPYVVETIGEDALRAGPGARLEVSVPATVPDTTLAVVAEQFAWLVGRGVQVSVRRDHHLGPVGVRTRPHAA